MKIWCLSAYPQGYIQDVGDFVSSVEKKQAHTISKFTLQLVTRAATTNRSNRLLSIMNIIDNDSHYRLAGSARSARPTSAGCSNYSTE